MSRVDLVWLSAGAEIPSWSLGEVRQIDPTLEAMSELVREQLPKSLAVAWLFWDSALGNPDTRLVQQLLSQTADVWHSGLLLGMKALPGLTDFVNPTWMLNCDADQTSEATSWRLALRACLARTEALRQLGGPRREFQTLAGAGLEMGHRYVSRGAIVRHVPSLMTQTSQLLGTGPTLTFQDELRFVYYRFGGFWSKAALLRAAVSGYVSVTRAARAWQVVRRESRRVETAALDHSNLQSISPSGEARVSVLIPTLDRYSYLRTLLAQLRQQTIKPLEIVIVDQTARERRDHKLAIDFADLPLEIINLDQAGQCSSRNEGLSRVRGDYVLFIDDDDEVPPTLIADHLLSLARFRADVSSGVANEVGATTERPSSIVPRLSDVFPTNNTLVRREVLEKSGLFDLAYERGQRADGDLGMRVYLSGALMILDPQISVLHHHAPSGGLRTHKARVITYASSRKRLRHRQLPSATEIYLARRYFTARQVREMIWLGILGTFSIRGSAAKKMLKIVAALIYLPHTMWRVKQHCRQAESMLQQFPKIPGLEARTANHNCPARDYSDSRVSVAAFR